MGTRVDFYVGRGEAAEWLGSYPFDGYPDGVFGDVGVRPRLFAESRPTEDEWRAWVSGFVTRKEDRGTTPEMGWPWPWEDSRTTDWAYAWEDGAIYGSNFGHSWFRIDPTDDNWGHPVDDEGDWVETPKDAVFPNMSAHKNVTYGPRSGLKSKGTRLISRPMAQIPPSTIEATRLAKLWNGMWAHHLEQQDVDALVEEGRLHDFTHTWTPGKGWTPIEPAPVVTAEQVNRWSLRGFGHDSINCWVVVSAACKRAGEPETCGDCDGHGSVERYPGQRTEAEAWEEAEPPSGDGWQLWETVTEGSPISPVFASADELAGWMASPDRGADRVSIDVASRFIEAGWAPTLASSPQTGVITGVEFVGSVERDTQGVEA